MIAISGAAGKTGRALIRALAARGAEVRALVHRPERTEALAALGAAEVVPGDLTDPAELEQALEGSWAVYHICPNMRPDEEAIGARVLEACRRAGVERVVYHSVLHPHIEAMPHHWQKLRVEEGLIESGLAFTILQPAAYMQNVRAQWKEVTTRGILEVPYAATTRLGMVDVADVAEAAARVVTEAGHDGAIYELCGPEVLDQHEVGTVLAAALDRPVEVSVVPRDEWRRRAREAGSSEYAVEGLLAMFRHYERHGFWGNSGVLAMLLGRSPATFADVVARWHEASQGDQGRRGAPG